MGETEVIKSDSAENKTHGNLKAFNPSLSSFFVQLPQMFQNCKTQLKRFAEKDRGRNLDRSIPRKEKTSPPGWEANLEKQIQAWKQNPLWVDQTPEIKVNVPKGSLCNLSVNFNVGLPPDAVYNIVTDPDNKRVFKNIKEVLSRNVLVNEGQRQVVELEQAALWKFLWWSGVISVHVLVDQNREDYSMKFKQLKTGFMEKFEGCWKVEPLFVDEDTCHPFKPKSWGDYHSCTGGKGRIGSKVSLEQLIQPAVVPPPPISWYLRGITMKTTEMLTHDLLAEAARIRQGFTELSNEVTDTYDESDEHEVNKLCNIKERWALHRKIAKQRPRRLLKNAD